MSVLSDRDIRAAIDAGDVKVRPYDPKDLQPSSIDLHLDRSFRVFRNNRYAYIDVRAPQPENLALAHFPVTNNLRATSPSRQNGGR